MLKGLSVGDQIKVNHEGCTAGLDTKKRLYVKRVPSGGVAYCHHCNQAGYVRELNVDGTKLRKWLLDKPGGDVIRTSSATPPGLRPLFWSDTKDIPALLWLKKHYINGQEERFQFFSDYSGNLVFNLRSRSGLLTGHQIRSFTGGPKYITYNSMGSVDGSWFKSAKQKDTLVITEDYVSAFRVAEDCPEVSSLALLRTSCSSTNIEHMKSFLKVIIWLDPDEAGQRGAKELQKRLDYLLPFKCIRANSKFVEPKQLSPIDLPTVIRSIS